MGGDDKKKKGRLNFVSSKLRGPKSKRILGGSETLIPLPRSGVSSDNVAHVRGKSGDKLAQGGEEYVGSPLAGSGSLQSNPFDQRMQNILLGHVTRLGVLLQADSMWLFRVMIHTLAEKLNTLATKSHEVCRSLVLLSIGVCHTKKAVIMREKELLLPMLGFSPLLLCVKEEKGMLEEWGTREGVKMVKVEYEGDSNKRTKIITISDSTTVRAFLKDCASKFHLDRRNTPMKLVADGASYSGYIQETVLLPSELVCISRLLQYLLLDYLEVWLAGKPLGAIVSQRASGSVVVGVPQFHQRRLTVSSSFDMDNVKVAHDRPASMLRGGSSIDIGKKDSSRNAVTVAAVEEGEEEEKSSTSENGNEDNLDLLSFPVRKPTRDQESISPKQKRSNTKGRKNSCSFEPSNVNLWNVLLQLLERVPGIMMVVEQFLNLACPPSVFDVVARKCILTAVKKSDDSNKSFMLVARACLEELITENVLQALQTVRWIHILLADELVRHFKKQLVTAPALDKPLEASGTLSPREEVDQKVLDGLLQDARNALLGRMFFRIFRSQVLATTTKLNLSSIAGRDGPSQLGSITQSVKRAFDLLEQMTYGVPALNQDSDLNLMASMVKDLRALSEAFYLPCSPWEIAKKLRASVLYDLESLEDSLLVASTGILDHCGVTVQKEKKGRARLQRVVSEVMPKSRVASGSGVGQSLQAIQDTITAIENTKMEIQSPNVSKLMNRSSAVSVVRVTVLQDKLLKDCDVPEIQKTLMITPSQTYEEMKEMLISKITIGMSGTKLSTVQRHLEKMKFFTSDGNRLPPKALPREFLDASRKPSSTGNAGYNLVFRCADNLSSSLESGALSRVGISMVFNENAGGEKGSAGNKTPSSTYLNGLRFTILGPVDSSGAVGDISARFQSIVDAAVAGGATYCKGLKTERPNFIFIEKLGISVLSVPYFLELSQSPAVRVMYGIDYLEKCLKAKHLLPAPIQSSMSSSQWSYAHQINSMSGTHTEQLKSSIIACRESILLLKQIDQFSIQGEQTFQIPKERNDDLGISRKLVVGGNREPAVNILSFFGVSSQSSICSRCQRSSGEIFVCSKCKLEFCLKCSKLSANKTNCEKTGSHNFSPKAEDQSSPQRMGGVKPKLSKLEDSNGNEDPRIRVRKAGPAKDGLEKDEKVPPKLDKKTNRRSMMFLPNLPAFPTASKSSPRGVGPSPS